MSRTMQELHYVNVFTSSEVAAYEDFFNGDPTSKYVNLGKYEKATWALNKAAGSTGTAVITVLSASASDGTGATAIPFEYKVATSGDTFSNVATATSAGYTTTAGANQVVVVEVNSAELDAGDKWVAIKFTESANDPVDAGCICHLSGGRVVQEVPITALT